MTSRAWDDLGVDWSVQVSGTDPAAIHRAHPLASRGGVNMLSNILAASAVWRNLTKPQRELLLSTVAGAPVAARRDVVARMVARGLLNAADGMPCATAAGRAVVEWRCP